MPNRSTSSATTARFTADEQQAICDWLLRGASPLGACQQLDVSIDRFWRTLDEDQAFTAAVQRVFDTLSLNVVSAIYQAAMKGNTSAQQTWLKHRTAWPWRQVANPFLADDGLEQLPDGELLDECGASGVDLPTATAARLGPPTG